MLGLIVIKVIVESFKYKSIVLIILLILRDTALNYLNSLPIIGSFYNIKVNILKGSYISRLYILSIVWIGN